MSFLHHSTGNEAEDKMAEAAGCIFGCVALIIVGIIASAALLVWGLL